MARISPVGIATLVGFYYLLTRKSGPASASHDGGAPPLPATSGATFEADVLAASTPVVVDFSATWCGPCEKMAPHLQVLAQEHAGKLKLVKVDIDASPDLADQYDISSIPRLLAFKNGEVVDDLLGFPGAAKVKAFVETQLA